MVFNSYVKDMQIKDLTPELVLEKIRGNYYSKNERRDILNLLLDGIVAGQVEFDISKIEFVRSRKRYNIFSLSQTYLSTERFTKTYDLMLEFKPDFSLWKNLWDTKHNDEFISMTPLKMAIINQNIEMFEEIVKILMNTEAPKKSFRYDTKTHRFELHGFIEETIVDENLRAEFLDILENRERYVVKKRKRVEDPENALELEAAEVLFNISNSQESSEEELSISKRQKTKEDDSALKPKIVYGNSGTPAAILSQLPDGRETFELLL